MAESDLPAIPVEAGSRTCGAFPARVRRQIEETGFVFGATMLKQSQTLILLQSAGLLKVELRSATCPSIRKRPRHAHPDKRHQDERTSASPGPFPKTERESTASLQYKLEKNMRGAGRTCLEK